MLFESQAFLLEFLPALLAIFFAVRGIAALCRLSMAQTTRLSLVVLTLGSLWVVTWIAFGWLLVTAVAVTLVVAIAIERIVQRSPKSSLAAGLAVLVVTMIAAVFAIVRWQIDGRTFAFAGVSVICCHCIAFVFDVYRREARAREPLTAVLYLTQFPVLPAGPIVRSRDFAQQHLRLADFVSLGGFTYGMRRLIIGVVKIRLVGGALAVPVDAIFRLPASRLSTEAAWLAAIAYSLELYFVFSGYADIAIGVGRMFGLRYPENFRRPYVADSIREFWRRWHITAITWLRDYLSLPIAGRDAPTPRLFLNIVLGFALLGLWHGGGTTVLLWAVYSGGWLALEALGLGTRIERLPRLLRHLYVLLIVTVGWTLLRADSPAHAWQLLQAMAGVEPATAQPVSRYLTWGFVTALLVAAIGAGPLVPWISRWRVTLDAATAAIVMMMTALSLFAWRPFVQLGEMIRFPRRKPRPKSPAG